MRPGSAINNHAYSCFRHSKFFGNGGLHFACGMALSNHIHQIIGQFCLRQLLTRSRFAVISPYQSSPIYRILGILLSRARVKMRRVAARFVVTIMQNPQAIRYLFLLKQFPCNTMRPLWIGFPILFYRELPISEFVFTAKPRPAAIDTPFLMSTALNLCPETTTNRLWTNIPAPPRAVWHFAINTPGWFDKENYATGRIFADTCNSHSQPPEGWIIPNSERVATSRELAFGSYPSHTQHKSIAHRGGN